MTVPNHTDSSSEPHRRVRLTPETMAPILADVAAMTDPQEIDLWASWMLGQAWKQRTRVPCHTEVDWLLLTGGALVQIITQSGTSRQAHKALTALAMLDHGAFGNYAGAVALSLADTPLPMVPGVGACTAIAAWQTSTCGQGSIHILTLARHGVLTDTALAVFSDARQGGAVTRIHLIPADAIPAACDAIDLVEAAVAIRDAIAVIDADPSITWASHVADLRAYALAALPN